MLKIKHGSAEVPAVRFICQIAHEYSLELKTLPQAINNTPFIMVNSCIYLAR